MNSREIVRQIYLGLLGREPDQDGLVHHAGNLDNGAATVGTMLAGFVRSDEFRQRAGTAAPSAAMPHPVDMEPPLAIDLDLSPAQMATLWAHVAQTWSRLGTQDPYWSVLSDPRFRMGQMSDAAVLQLFYESGRRELHRLDAWLFRNGLALQDDMVVAEYGCGVGRLTGWLAPRCRRLRAFDISPTHLARARDHVLGRGITNVDFHLVRDPADLNLLAGIDLFFSVIVLQHNPPPIIQLVLGQAFRHLNPGGIAFVQVPTHRNGYEFDLADYLGGLAHTAAGGGDGIEMHVLPPAQVFRLAGRHGLIPRDVQPDGLVGDFGHSTTFLFAKPA